MSNKTDPFLSRIADWLRTCYRDHGDCYRPPLDSSELSQDRRLDFRERVQSNFRLLDVELGCVIDASLDERYIALSYVCNPPSMFTLGRSNVERMYVEGYLERIRSNLPKTINDAIDLVKNIGERYLWVDSLCLIGDDEGDITLGIRIMNSIFQGSYFTIVAASGVDANAGLCAGTSDTKGKMVRRSPEVAIDLKTRLSKSEYNKRGWTLQELNLSRRALIFVDNQVFFSCQSATWDDKSSLHRLRSLAKGDATETRICGIPDSRDNILPCLSAYLELFEEYSRRELRYDGDALRGFYGLIRPLFAGMKTPSVEGIPGFYVNAAILFTSPGGNLRRRHDFPSFSWTGWAGELRWPRENLIWWLGRNEIAEWDVIETTVDQGNIDHLSRGWQALEGESNLVLLLKQYPHVFDSKTVEARRWYEGLPSTGFLSPGPGWERAVSKAGNPKMSNKKEKPQYCTYAMRSINSQAEFNRYIQETDWGPYAHYMIPSCIASHRARLSKLRAHIYYDAMKDIRRLGKDWPVALRPNTAVSGFIKACGRDRRVAGWKRHIDYASQYIDEDQEPLKSQPPKFPDYSVLQTWTIHLRLTLAAPLPASKPPRPLLSASGATIGSLHPDNISLLPTAPTPITLIVLSRCQTPIHGSALLDIEKEHMPQPGQPWDLLWVMHVETRDRMSERRGIGQVMVGALEDAVGKPEVKLVVLG